MGLLLVFFSWTLLMASINLVQEGSGSQISQDLSSVFASVLLVGFSGFSQVPGLFVAWWRWKGSAKSVPPMLFAAYVIALTGVAAFTGFASQTGPSDSMNSAAHMHIFLFPLLHLVFSGMVYFVASLCTIGCVLYWRYYAGRADSRGRADSLDKLQ